MVTRVIACYHCDSQNIVKNGKAPNGKQKYLCHDCHRQSREDPDSNAYPSQRREEILCALTRNAPLSEASRAPSESRPTASRAGSKKPLETLRLCHEPCCPRHLPKKQISCSNSTSCARLSPIK